ncbi:hypothetical protein QSH57_014020 [Fusarium oxysporum f. sp. vasinfectum]|nr:hypothetical protein QSH57_014020 [Fusarium oxysporum f. sp. vasinfectum]
MPNHYIAILDGFFAKINRQLLPVNMQGLSVNCSQWTELDDFSGYIQDLSSETRFDLSLLEPCKSEICNAIYGTGNPDISGIGVASSFSKRSGNSSQWYLVARTGLGVFFDCAAYFALSLQLATIAVLVRKDYGISTADLGTIEARISQTVAVVCMMSLLYPVALLEPVERTHSRAKVKHNARLLLLSLTVALSFYPFLSRCIHVFDASAIGKGKGSEVSPSAWNAVEEMCFPGRTKTYKSLDGLELTASLITYMFTFWLLAGLPGTCHDYEGKGKGAQLPEERASWRERVNQWFGDRRLAAIVPLCVVVGLAVPLLWLIFTLRRVQQGMTEDMEGQYDGNSWGFGQIVSIVLFVPVRVEMAYRWRFGASYGQDD